MERLFKKTVHVVRHIVYGIFIPDEEAVKKNADEYLAKYRDYLLYVG